MCRVLRCSIKPLSISHMRGKKGGYPLTSLYIGGIEKGQIAHLRTRNEKGGPWGAAMGTGGEWAPAIRSAAGHWVVWSWGPGVVGLWAHWGVGLTYPAPPGPRSGFAPGAHKTDQTVLFLPARPHRQRPHGGKCGHICMDFPPHHRGRPLYQGLQAVKATASQATGRLRLDSGMVRRSDDENDCDQ